MVCRLDMLFGLTLVACQALVATAALAPTSAYTQTVFNGDNVHFRPATEADLDDIITIIIDAFAPGPMWQYGFPYLSQHKDYLWHCLRKDLGEQYKHVPNTTTINVIAVTPSADTSDDAQQKERVVALGAWKDMTATGDTSLFSAPGLSSIQSLHAKCSDHLEANMTRVEDAQRQSLAYEKRYIEDSKEKQLYLALLATHPSWDGHGFGAAHVQWGLEKARAMEGCETVTLLGTPAGWPLYDSLGFDSVTNLTITTLDEDMDDLWFEYMRYDLPREEL
ncbi:hypothetical protein S40293_08682 [Stachybotrys chartarum IBT 40293]|nr:hypothetical protein S40293_08682 [Stachybotrys chartarum IBT 40293]